MWLPLCGILFFLGLVCLGLCLEELSTYLPVGGRLEGQRVLRFGRWCPFVFFGVFGMRETLDVSKTWKIPWRIVASFLHMLCLWTVAFLSPLSISYSDFLVRFSLPS
jgi:hypothetical protein